MATANAIRTVVFPAPPFVPRQVFDVSPSLIRSYFLGHHNAALERMRRALSSVGLVIECRDLRVPVTSWNPLLESSLMYNSDFRQRTNQGSSPPRMGGGAGGRARIIVYTHRDLVAGKENRRMIETLEKFHKEESNTAVVFHGTGSEIADTKNLLGEVRRISNDHHSLTGLRALVVGMPNAGKSTLLNRLRTHGKANPGGAAKVARTGAEPGVTRKLGTPVRIIGGAGDDHSESVLVVDTPGVFIPFVPDAESMLKLALVGSVKDGLVPWLTVADYLLYHLNLHDPTGEIYRVYCDEPTNDVHKFLRGVARRTGKLIKGSGESLEGAADWVVRRWRKGLLGRFALDQVSKESLEEAMEKSLNPQLSLNQARKREKEQRKERLAAKRAQT